MAGLPACGLFRGGSGTKQRLDAPHVAPHHPTNVKPRTMVIEVVTDAEGAVASVTFKQSSGSQAVDDYAAVNIRNSWPPTPSTDPKMLSTSPAP